MEKMKDNAPFYWLPNNEKPHNYPQKFMKSNEYPLHTTNSAAKEVHEQEIMEQTLNAK